MRKETEKEQDQTSNSKPLLNLLLLNFLQGSVKQMDVKWKKKIINYIYSLLNKCKLKILKIFLLDFVLILKNNISSRALIN